MKTAQTTPLECARASAGSPTGPRAGFKSCVSFPPPCGVPPPCGEPCSLTLGPERHAVIESEGSARVVLTVSPTSRGPFDEQLDQVLAQARCILDHQDVPLAATNMTVFLRDRDEEVCCASRLQTWFGDLAPVTTFAIQPPCDGAALALELWAAGGPDVVVDRPGPQVCSVRVDGIRWIHCCGIGSDDAAGNSGNQFRAGFEQMKQLLAQAGVGFENVMRTWFYIDGINEAPLGESRYQELNRVRADLYRGITFGPLLRPAWLHAPIYPASTATGTRGRRPVMGCLALESQRPDVFILPLENPRQSSPHPDASAHSLPLPRFSRAVAVGHGHSLTAFVSGTAGVVDFRTVHPDDPIRQTEEAIEHIERLIAPENFGRHGLPGAGGSLSDLAMARVYVRRSVDFPACRDVCERRLGRVPMVFVEADICRPDLLVEIEAVAVSPLRGNLTQHRA